MLRLDQSRSRTTWKDLTLFSLSIDMWETVEEKGNYLRSACSAWNIACLPTLKREQVIKQYVEEYQKINQANGAHCKALEEDIRLLIKQKERLYPDIKIQIVDSRIERINGQGPFAIISARTR